MIDAPKMILDLPTGRIYQHTNFSSYTMFSHRETLKKIDQLGYMMERLSERLTKLEDSRESTTVQEPSGSSGSKDQGSGSQGTVPDREAGLAREPTSDTPSTGGSDGRGNAGGSEPTGTPSSKPAVLAKTQASQPVVAKGNA